MRLSVSILAAPALRRLPALLALPVGLVDAADDAAGLLPTAWAAPDSLTDEAAALLRDQTRSGRDARPGSALAAGRIHHLPRPTREPAHVLLFGIGDSGGGDPGAGDPGSGDPGASDPGVGIAADGDGTAGISNTTGNSNTVGNSNTIGDGDTVAADGGPADGAGRRQAWRSVGAALYRAAAERGPALTVVLPDSADPAAVHELAVGAWLAAYRFELPGRGPGSAKEPPALRRIVLVSDPDRVAAAEAAVTRAQALAEAVSLARDLTNTPSARKSPAWFADRITAAAARRPGVSVKVLDQARLAEAGFGGLLAVGGGSPRPPALVELSWRPRGARVHVVLAGKGICFDTGGISIKPLDGMRLMRKDMGAAATVCATVLAAADLGLPIRVTALAALAENMVSGSSMRPGDVIRHYGGTTTEVLDTDAEGRLVLGDALAYAAKRLRPDWLIDLATLTGASHVALGKRTAALFTSSPELAESLRSAGAEAGEPVWPLPLLDDYVGLLRSDVADLANIGRPAQAGAVVAALYLRELVGDYRDRWAHIDMSAPAWSDREDGPLVKGATGWGVRLLIRFLASLTSP